MQGSWRDSGINALSVLLRIIPDLEVAEGLQGKNHNYDCDTLSGLVTFKFDYGMRGVIDTNWLLGLNRKTTRLDFVEVGYQGNIVGSSSVILDHSGQRVIYQPFDEGAEVLAQLGEGRERLTNHYRGVFAEFHDVLRENYLENGSSSKDNRDYSRKCLKLLIDAEK